MALFDFIDAAPATIFYAAVGTLLVAAAVAEQIAMRRP